MATYQGDDGSTWALLELEWDKNIELDMGHYVAAISRDNVKWQEQTVEHEGATDPVTCTFLGLTPGATYYARVRAVDTARNESAWVNFNAGAAITMPADLVAPGTPANLSVTAAKKAIRIQVDKSSSADWAGHEYHVSTSSGFTPSAGTLVDSSKSTAITHPCASYVVHYVRVRAYDRTGNFSAYTSQGSATPQQIDAPTDIPANNIPSGKIISLDYAKITSVSIATADIQNLAVTSGKIANNTITATQIANNTITATQIGNLTITASEIANLTITGGKIANATIESAKIVSLDCSKINAGTISSVVLMSHCGGIDFDDGGTLQGSGGSIQCTSPLDLVGSGELHVDGTTAIATDGAFWMLGLPIITTARVLQNVTIAAGVTGGGGLNVAQVGSKAPGTSVGNLAYYDASGRVVDSQLLDGNEATAFATSGHTHALGDLSNVTATGEGSGGGFDADTVDAKEPGTTAGKLAYYDANTRVLDSVKVGGYAAATANTASTAVIRDASNDIYVGGAGFIAGLRPMTDNTGICGASNYRWADIYGVVIHEGDHVFEEKTCAICGEPFKRGQNLVYHVLSVGDEGTRAVPAHTDCAGKLVV